MVLDEPTAAELAILLEPLDSELAKAHTASYAAPRVGTLCLLHSWVMGAGWAWEEVVAAPVAALPARLCSSCKAFSAMTAARSPLRAARSCLRYS